MGQPSFQASNAILWVTYGLFLIFGVVVAWKLRTQATTEFLSSNRTQKGILAVACVANMSRYQYRFADQLHCNKAFLWLSTSLPVLCSLNLALGSGILLTYPQIATIAGVQGLVIYALSSSLPILAFAAIGPIIRRKCPDGFVLTEWTRQRYGALAALFLSAMTLITLFLYMVSELSALQQIVATLTGSGTDDRLSLPAVVVEVVVTTIYTCIGGFKISFVTDNIQGTMVVLLIIIGVITVGVETRIDPAKIDQSGYLNASLLGWQLLYILPVAVLTNDFFLSNLWQRTFASKTDKDLWIGASIATVAIAIILTLVGTTGLLATWSGALPLGSQDGYLAFFLLLEQLPAYVVGIILVMVVSLSTSAFDSLQSAMVSTGSNDLFRNKLNIWFVRVCVVLVIIPVAVVALKSPDILQIYLISDLVSAAVIPVLLVGLCDRFYWWRGFEVVVGGLGGIIAVFIFGTIYYGNAEDGGRLILLENGLYANDWGAFGAFVAAPVGGMLFGIAALVVRLGVLWIVAKATGQRFDALDKPDVIETTPTSSVYAGANGVEAPEPQHVQEVVVKPKGKFF